jgi:hypothetical protein
LIDASQDPECVVREALQAILDLVSKSR